MTFERRKTVSLNFSRAMAMVLLSLMAAFSAPNLMAQETGKQLRWKLAVGDKHTVIINQNSLITTIVDSRKRVLDNQLISHAVVAVG